MCAGLLPPTFDLQCTQNRIINDQNPLLGHILFAILANRAAYCIELDSHKGFAA